MSHHDYWAGTSSNDHQLLRETTVSHLAWIIQEPINGGVMVLIFGPKNITDKHFAISLKSEKCLAHHKQTEQTFSIDLRAHQPFSNTLEMSSAQWKLASHWPAITEMLKLWMLSMLQTGASWDFCITQICSAEWSSLIHNMNFNPLTLYNILCEHRRC